jgi:hypothetical protein
VGLTVRVSGVADLSGSEMGSTFSFSPARICGPACGHQRGSACWSHQARELSHVASQLRNPSARRRLRHPDGAGTTRSCRRVDNDDLPARDAPRSPGRAKSVRPAVTVSGGGWLQALQPAAQNRLLPEMVKLLRQRHLSRGCCRHTSVVGCSRSSQRRDRSQPRRSSDGPRSVNMRRS